MVGDSGAGWHWSLGMYGATGVDGAVIVFGVFVGVLALLLALVASRPRKVPPPSLTWAKTARPRAATVSAKSSKPGTPVEAPRGSSAVRPPPPVARRRKDPITVRSYRRMGPLLTLQPVHQAPGLSNFVARRRPRR